MSFLSRPRVKQWGWVMLFGLGCFAAGNFHQTKAALQGQGNWYRGWCAKQERTIMKNHEALDQQKYGW